MAELTARALAPNALFSLRFVHDARLSPDGRQVAYVTSRTVEASDEELFELDLLELAGGAALRVEFGGNVASPRWSPDGSRLAFVGTVNGATRVYLSNADGSGVRALTPEGAEVQGAPSWSPDSASIAYCVGGQRTRGDVPRITKRVFRAEEVGDVEHLFSMLQVTEVRSGATRTLNTGRGAATQPLFSPCGKRILFFAADAAVADSALVGGLSLCTLELADERRVAVLEGRWFISAAAWSPCGERIVFAGTRDSVLIVPKADLWVIDRDGSNARCRTPGLMATVGFRMHHDMPTWGTTQDSMLSVADTQHAYATVMKGGCTEIWKIALDGEISARAVVSGLRSCVILDSSATTSRLLYCASDLHTPWDLCLSNLEGREERRLTQLNTEVLQRWPALRCEHLKFSSDDGRALEGWHVQRADRTGPQPTVLFIHGGPMLAVGHVFRFDFHLLAANGYAVMFSNFRGSSGYGEAHTQALVGDWGSRGFPDHMAAVDASIERGLADFGRLGVWGPSHGGFATCWSVTHTNRFRAAVAEASCTNFVTMYYLSDAPDLWVKDLGGKPHEIPDIYRSRSPLTYAPSCRTPTLMLHGEDDLRCPVAEAEQFYRALHDVGCKTELVRIPGATHMGDSIGPLSARRTQNEALLDWFERHL